MGLVNCLSIKEIKLYCTFSVVTVRIIFVVQFRQSVYRCIASRGFQLPTNNFIFPQNLTDSLKQKKSMIFLIPLCLENTICGKEAHPLPLTGKNSPFRRLGYMPECWLMCLEFG